MVRPLKPENEILYKHIVNKCMRTFFGPGINNTKSIEEKIINFESRFGLKYDLGKLNIIVRVFSRINQNSEEGIDSVLDVLGGKKRKTKRKSKRKSKTKTKTKRKRKSKGKSKTNLK